MDRRQLFPVCTSHRAPCLQGLSERLDETVQDTGRFYQSMTSDRIAQIRPKQVCLDRRHYFARDLRIRLTTQNERCRAALS